MSKVHFIIDEAATVKSLESVHDAINLGRGYGIRLQLYFQSAGQFKLCFPEGQEQTLLSNTTQIFFGVNDQQTAEMVSNRLGEKTIVVNSGGTSKGTSHSFSRGPHHNVTDGSSGNQNKNWQQQARKLLKPEEVIALPQRTALTFTPGVRPVMTTLIRHYEENLNPGWFRRARAGCSRLAISAFVCAFSLCVAWAAQEMVAQHMKGVHHVGTSKATVRWDKRR